ncbi:MAG: hypothetical protein U0V49_02115 [Saprospiraceae bacterium]
MDNIIEKMVQYIEKVGGKIVKTYDGYDGNLFEADILNLTPNKYVLPYVLFNSDYKTFLKIGEKCSQFNMESKNNDKFIHWKVIVIEWDKENAEYCLSATTNRMDLFDASVVTGLTKEKRSELLKVSIQILRDFLNDLEG